MRRKITRVVTIAVLIGTILCFLSVSHASNPEIERSVGTKLFHKLGRGITNVFTGWIEIPRGIAQTWRETDPFTGFFVGGCKGIAWGWVRTMSGFYDILTFPIPAPTDYQPLFEPEFILPEIWGETLPELPGEEFE